MSNPNNNDNKFFKKFNNITIHNNTNSGIRNLKHGLNKERDSFNKTFNNIPQQKVLYKTFRENKVKLKIDCQTNRSRSFRTNSNYINTERGHNYTRSELVNKMKRELNQTTVIKSKII